jgi:hypothetical protein
MLAKTITYTDYDGNERTEVFRFNLSRAEIAEMEFTTTGGLVRQIEKITAEKDAKQIIELFKTIILKAYGEKSVDGKRFVKSQELQDSFSQSEAYSVLFMELASNAEAAAAFVNGIVPQKL